MRLNPNAHPRINIFTTNNQPRYKTVCFIWIIISKLSVNQAVQFQKHKILSWIFRSTYVIKSVEVSNDVTCMTELCQEVVWSDGRPMVRTHSTIWNIIGFHTSLFTTEIAIWIDRKWEWTKKNYSRPSWALLSHKIMRRKRVYRLEHQVDNSSKTTR